MTETAKLSASDGTDTGHFGEIVAIDGEIIVVTDSFNDDGATEAGAAYVFQMPSGGWVNATESVKLLPSDPTADQQFGRDVSVSGDVVVIGASRHDGACPGDPNCNSGLVYVFHGLSDCNNNDTLDVCDVDGGSSEDCNADGRPDECFSACLFSFWVGGGAGIWNDPLNWCPEVVPNNGNGDEYAVVVGKGVAITLDIDVTICSLDLAAGSSITATSVGASLEITDSDGLFLGVGATILVDNGNQVVAGGVISNNGSVTLLGASSTAQFVPAEAGTSLAGVGELRIVSAANSQVGAVAASLSLVNDVGHTICGTGRIVGNFQNEGMVIADSVAGNALTLEGVGTTRTNNHHVHAVSDGEVRIAGTFTQGAGGEIAACGNSSVLLGDLGLETATIEGGLIRQSTESRPGTCAAGATFSTNRVKVGNLTGIRNVTIQGALTVPGLPDACFFRGSIVNSGKIEVTGSDGDLSRIGPDEDTVTFSGNGAIELRHHERAILDHFGPAFPEIINGEDHEIRGIGVIQAPFVNEGTIRAIFPPGGFG